MPEMPYTELEGNADATTRCGGAQIGAAFFMIATVAGTIALSMRTSGYDTSEYNWVDNCRVGFPRFIGALLSLLYGQATLGNHLAFITTFGKPCLDPENKETTESIWARTPSEARGSAVSSGGWCVGWAITVFSMTFFEPGCQRGLCLSLMCCFIWWNVVWYGAMLGRVDVDDERKLPAMNWFKAESIQEIVLIAIFGYLVFFAGDGAATAPKLAGTNMDTARIWVIRFMGGLLTLLYGAATLGKQTMFVSDLSKPLVTEGSDPAEIWRRTPTVSKHSAVSSGGWCVCLSLTMLLMTFVEPGCEKGLCKCFALVMVWWQCVWYTGMLNRVDFNDPIKRPWTNWFKAETIQEIVIFCVTGYLGFVAK